MIRVDIRIVIEHLLARQDAGCDIGARGLSLPIAWADVALERGHFLIVELL